MHAAPRMHLMYVVRAIIALRAMHAMDLLHYKNAMHARFVCTLITQTEYGLVAFRVQEVSNP